MEQKYNSACTSINVKRLPAIFSMVNWDINTPCIPVNVDYGCGKYINHINDYMSEKGWLNLGIDKYNQTKAHNERCCNIIKTFGGADTCTCSNVLNVICERDIRLYVITDIYNLLCADGVAYFTVYEGDKSGNIAINVKRESVQLNRITTEYISEIAEIFGFENVKIRGKLIIAYKGGEKNGNEQ